MQLLSDEFVETYKNKKPPFGGEGLGEFVYLRTYSRFLEKENRREEWYETVRRVVEYSMSLHIGKGNLTREAESLFDNIFNLRLFPAGRTLWIGGTKAAEKFPMANFNCSFRVIDSLDAFTEIFYLLMLGCGTGFRILPDDVAKLPKFIKRGKLEHAPYEYNGDEFSEAQTRSFYLDTMHLHIIRVGDSKEGWVDALKSFFEAKLYGRNIKIFYNDVRPEGSILKTFGGRASGPTSLRNMFENINDVINNSPLQFPSNNVTFDSYTKLRPIDALDICNIIAYNVVVGGVRRSSQIALFDINDKDVLNAKVDLYTPGSSNYGKYWRAMSNNSIFFTEKPSQEQLIDIFERISHNGEPGFLNAVAASERRPNYEGGNPCMEILLDNRGMCNLTEVNLNAFVLPDYGLDETGVMEAVYHAVRVGLRQTNVTLELPEWDKIQKRDRLIGVSLTGVMDAFDGLNWPSELRNEFLLNIREFAQETAREYAKEMRIPEPLLVTTVKPSGTLSQLPTVSSGVHRSFAQHYIRRVRVTSSDPIAKTVYNLGYPTYPETGQGPIKSEFDKLDWTEKDNVLKSANTWVVEFPVQTNGKIQASEESAVKQFNRYLNFQEFWTDHNTSITIYFKQDEVGELIEKILQNWDRYIAVSFLPTDNNTYNLMPYEITDQQDYFQRKVSVIPEQIKPTLNNLETGFIDEVLDPSCASGICPVR